MQYYLMTQHRLGLWDVSIDNFRLDKDGQFWFVDYGRGVAALDNPVCADRGLFEYGFVMLMLSAYGINLRVARPHFAGYGRGSLCSYRTELTGLAVRHAWIDAVLSKIRDADSRAFAEPELYRRIGDQLPRRVPWPVQVMVASKLMTGVGRLRSSLRRKLSDTRALTSLD